MFQNKAKCKADALLEKPACIKPYKYFVFTDKIPRLEQHLASLLNAIAFCPIIVRASDTHTSKQAGSTSIEKHCFGQ